MPRYTDRFVAKTPQDEQPVDRPVWVENGEGGCVYVNTVDDRGRTKTIMRVDVEGVYRVQLGAGCLCGFMIDEDGRIALNE